MRRIAFYGKGGIGRVAVASFLDMDPASSEEGDIHLDGEDALISLISRHRYDIILGDPLYRGLTTSPEEGRFISVPHPALSSRLYWNDTPD